MMIENILENEQKIQNSEELNYNVPLAEEDQRIAEIFVTESPCKICFKSLLFQADCDDI